MIRNVWGCYLEGTPRTVIRNGCYVCTADSRQKTRFELTFRNTKQPRFLNGRSGERYLKFELRLRNRAPLGGTLGSRRLDASAQEMLRSI